MSRTTGNFVPVVGSRPFIPSTTFPGFLQPETVAATIGGAPNASVAPGSNAQLAQFNQSKSKNAAGYKLPEAHCVWTTVPAGAQYVVGGRFSVPLLNDAIRGAALANINVAGAVSIASGTGTVVGISGEDIN
jgi:hypothetical protein